MIQLTLFTLPAQQQIPHQAEIRQAMQHAFAMWHRYATEIKPALNGCEFWVTFDDGSRAKVHIEFGG